MKKKLKRIISSCIIASMVLLMVSVCASCNFNDNKSVVKLGVDNVTQHMDLFEGKRVGLITNATGVNSNFESTIDIMKENTNLTTLFAPEHGIRGAVSAGDTVGQEIDEKSGLPVYSLYGQTKKPTPEMLENVDVLVYDIQDVGARFYTYISTMKYSMQAAAEKGIPFVVLDRPNPINGTDVQGAVIDSGFESFVGITDIPQRYGLTCGELAEYMNTEDNINCDLNVVEMTGWQRDMYYEDTGLNSFVMPSPNMPTIDTAVVYPGTCLFEGTNVSEGRGTTKPFEIIGAPWINSLDLADKLNSYNLDGVYFRATTFSPTTSKYEGETCNGVEIHVTDRTKFDSVKSAVTLLYTIRDMYPNDFQYLDNGQIENLTGGSYIKDSTYNLQELYTKYDNSSKDFKEYSSKYYLY